jgi:hypothetical protein
MMSRMSTLASGVGFVALAASGLGAPVAACQAAPKTAPAVQVRIVQPSEGDTITGSSVLVKLEAHGIEIAPAAEHRAGTAHHHLFLDVDVGKPGEGIPAGNPYIVHLGKGQSEYTFEGVANGPHRLIAVLADPDHLALQPWVVDTVNFVMRRR